MFTIHRSLITHLLCLLAVSTINSMSTPQKQDFQGVLFQKDDTATQSLSKLLVAFNILANTQDQIVKATQEAWLRPAHKERWESPNPHGNRKEELMPLFKEIGLVCQVKPSQKEYDFLLIMGALHKRAQMRIDYAVKLWKEGYRFKKIVVLGSERPLDAEQEPAHEFNTDEKPHNEFGMLKYCCNNSMPAEMLTSKNIIFIDTPNTIDAHGKIKRATTGDTINEWLKTENPKPGSCLVVSNQPHIGYQETVVKNLVPQTFSVEGTGDQQSPDTPVSDILDALARWIYNENQLRKKYATAH